MIPFLSLLTGCILPWAVPPGGPLPDGTNTSSVTSPGAPVSFAPLEQRVNVLLGETQDADRRDRLMEARELMQGMRSKDPAAQRQVYAYLDRVLAIEERARATAIPVAPLDAPLDEEPLVIEGPPAAPPPAPDPAIVLAGARAALADGRYLEAVAALDPLDAPDARALRKEAVDGWARVEREQVGHAFLQARALPAGAARSEALRTVRSRLEAINTRFPDNAYTAQILENISRVDADLREAQP